MEDYKLYTDDGRDMNILELETKSLIHVVNWWLAFGVYTSSIFYQALVDPPELQFVDCLGLSNTQHNYQYPCNIIALNQKYVIYLNPYHLDTLSPPIFSTEVIDKVVYHYLRLFLAQTDNFYKVQVEYKIAQLDIIVT